MRWVIALHVIAVIMWVGPLLLLTQMLALHAGEEAPAVPALRRVEGRLFSSIVNPSAAVVLVTGLLILLSAPGVYLKAHWFHLKLSLAVILFVLHLRIFRRMLALHAQPEAVPARSFLTLHLIAAAAVVAVVILVIVQPF
ncbi:MAG: CopD family protein [Deltaproteobacteria bacterium]|nr:CopD family protein [Deltaproteobacteria bacterium]